LNHGAWLHDHYSILLPAVVRPEQKKKSCRTMDLNGQPSTRSLAASSSRLRSMASLHTSTSSVGFYFTSFNLFSPLLLDSGAAFGAFYLTIDDSFASGAG